MALVNMTCLSDIKNMFVI